MKPQSRCNLDQTELFRNRLVNQLDMNHELIRLSKLIDWGVFDERFGQLYHANRGCHGKSTRLMVGLLYLKHIHKLSDKQVVAIWVENPYWQYFCGESYFQIDMPIDRSSLTRFRQRIGESGCEWLLQQMIEAGVSNGAVRKGHLKRETVDTTMQEETVSFQTDVEHGVGLRQSYARLGWWMLRDTRKLRTYLDRVVRDIKRKIAGNE